MMHSSECAVVLSLDQFAHHPDPTQIPMNHSCCIMFSLIIILSTLAYSTSLVDHMDET